MQRLPGTIQRVSVVDKYQNLNDLPVGCFIFDFSGKILMVNRSGANWLGREPEALVGSLFSQFLDEETSEVFFDHLDTVRVSSEAVSCTLTVQNQQIPAFSVQATSVALIDELTGENNAGECLSVFCDVSKWQKQEAQNRSEILHAHHVAREKTEFLARLSHELRSSLATMVGFADMLQESVDDDSRELAHMINTSGRHLLSTLNSVMDLARIEVLNEKVERTPVDVVAHTRERVLILKPLAHQNNLELEFSTGEEQAFSELNAVFLDRVLHNLIENAIKYTIKGRIKISVSIRDQHVCIDVKDTGIGIEETFLPNLFLPFERGYVPSERHTDGIGLGLAISKSLVELMDGNIYVVSKTGEGSTFTVRFPLQLVQESEDPGEGA